MKKNAAAGTYRGVLRRLKLGARAYSMMERFIASCSAAGGTIGTASAAGALGAAFRARAGAAFLAGRFAFLAFFAFTAPRLDFAAARLAGFLAFFFFADFFFFALAIWSVLHWKER
ncbi:MAG TPA: hypothetical protein VG798_08295 [Rhizomicrobium sp.]|nr:hypothetical protein [Rhizomicrobium sp.]